MVCVSVCPPELVDSSWNVISPLINRALKYCDGRVALEDIKSDAKDGNVTLWGVFEHDSIIAAAVTSVNSYPRKKVFSILLLGGERMDQWAALLMDRFRQTANLNNCDLIEVICGRPGWSRYLELYGFSDRKRVFMELKLK